MDPWPQVMKPVNMTHILTVVGVVGFNGGTFSLKGTNTQHCGHMGQFFQTEVMVEIYFKSLVGAIGKVLLMKFK